MKKSSKRVSYISSFACKEEHSQINASALLMLHNCYNNISFMGNKDSFKIINKILGDKISGISFNKIFVVPGNSRIRLLLRYLVSAIGNLYFLIRCNDEILFYNFNNVFAIKWINLINRWKKKNIIIMCHGELELLRPEIKKEGPLQRLLMNRVRNFFNQKTRFSKGLTFIVLGDSILHNLSKYLTESQLCHFFSIDHPYVIGNVCTTISTSKENDIIKIGCVGAINEIKGSKRLVQIANTLKHKRPDIKFFIVGKIFSHLQEIKAAGITMCAENNQPIPTEMFSKYIEDLDYVLFLYDENGYKFTASGAILDSIKYQKPVLTLSNNYFDYFLKKFDVPSYCATSLADLTDYIANLKKEYTPTHKAEFNRIKVEISPEFQVPVLYKNLESLSLI